MKFVFFLLLIPGRALADATLDGRVIDKSGAPLASLTVVIDGGGGQHVVTTAPDGRFHAVLDGSGTYSVTVASGSEHATDAVTIAKNGHASLTFELTEGGGEVIVIHDRPKPTYAKSLKDPRVLPPYSDEAVLTNTWSKAWLMLDVDANGAVTRMKFLKRPGHDLDKIAVATAFETKFTPARDGAGNPAPSFIVWPIEWPSYWWLADRFGQVKRMPSDVDGSFGVGLPPCAGKGPWQYSPSGDVSRDCSIPDLSRADAAEKWLTHVPK